MPNLTVSVPVDDFMQSADKAAMRASMDLGTAATTAATDYATAAQGITADSAIQPGDLATVATTGAYADLTGKPTLGTAAATNSTDYATAAQGVTADSAVQPGDLAPVATSGSASDLGTGTLPRARLPVPTSTLLGGVQANTGSGGQFVTGINTTTGALVFGTPSGSGDVIGPASSVNGNFPSFSGTGGKTLADSGVSASSFLTPSGNGSSLTGITASQVGLGNVTNDAQTKAAIVPNTAPTAGQILVGNAGNTAYAPVAASGDATLASTGAFTIANDAVTNAKLANMSASLIKARKTASTGDPEDCTLSEVLDLVGSAASGDILYRGASTWTRLAKGSDTQVLTLASGLPSWAAAGGGGGSGSTNVFVGAAEMIPRSTNGCGVNSSQTTTNLINYDTLDFDPATAEYAQFVRVMPNNWTPGTVVVTFQWTADSGSGDVVWAVNARSFADGDALDTAVGTAQTVTDTLGTAATMRISAATSAMTIAGTPANGTPVIFQVYRDAAAGGDTLATDARLIGVNITYT